MTPPTSVMVSAGSSEKSGRMASVHHYNPSDWTPQQNSEHGIRSGVVRRAKVAWRDQRILDLHHRLGLSCREIAYELARRKIAKIGKSMVNIVLRRAGIGFPLRSRRQHRWITNKRPVSNEPSPIRSERPDQTTSGGSGSPHPGSGPGAAKGEGVRWTASGVPVVPRAERERELAPLKRAAERERLAHERGWRKEGGIWTRLEA